jgi:succinate dehydrogenase/fumarate reductase flavoprotein subunit
MNPGAIQLYLDHGIDLTTEPLEVAVCAQHNNGGLAADAWWESLNVQGLFPVGEVNGSHGVCRPGGSALNSGQVGALRAAEQIAATRREPTLDVAAAQAAAKARIAELEAWLDGASGTSASWLDERRELQARMSRAGAHIRAVAAVRTARDEARAQVSRIQTAGCSHTGGATRAEALRTRSLAIAQLAYLDAIAFQLASGVGSRGSALVQEPTGTRIHPSLPAEWAFVPENPAFREQVLETLPSRDGSFTHRWVPRRPIPETDTWFETAWAAFRNGEIYR